MARRWGWSLLVLVASSTCSDGGNPPASDPCPDGRLRCGDDCLDPTSDDSCGACDVACDAQHQCAGGICERRCAGHLLYCDGACTDPFADPDHCGQCGEICFEGQICASGACTCLMGGTDCGGFCADIDHDPAHCGGCGRPCPGPFDVCMRGTCAQDCAAFGLVDCDGACVDLQSDPLHCGACGDDCNLGYDCIAGGCGCVDPVCGLCGASDLGMQLPAAVSGQTAGDSYLDPPCGDSGAPEVSHLFTAPGAGTYAFSTAGSGFDTVLHLYDTDACALLHCNDDNYSPQSLAFAELAAGAQLLAVVDGYDQSDLGAYQLTVTDTGCPAVDLGSTAPQSVAGHTDDSIQYFTGGCGGPGPERSYRFTAPATGSYIFDTIGSAIDTVIHARDGGCMGPELGCDDDGGGNDASLITLSLTQGQSVILFADGYFGSGSYLLNVSGPQ